MNFLEAVEALDSGKRIRRKSWKNPHAYWFKNGDYIAGLYGDQPPSVVVPDVGHIPQIRATDWEIMTDVEQRQTPEIER